jgi:hypothetical protein
MSFIDFFVFLFGTYGLSWLLVHSLFFSSFRKRISSVHFLADLFNCIICTSVWISGFFTFFYFPAECWYTKLLLVGTTVTATWILANLLDDIN